MGNAYFAWFESTESKSRINFLSILRCGREDYILSPEAIDHMVGQQLPKALVSGFSEIPGAVFGNQTQWMEKLSEMGVRSGRHIRIATEGALTGSILEHGFNVNLAILGDDAGQFNVFLHALSRIHKEENIEAQ